MAERNQKTHAFSSPRCEFYIRGVNKGYFESQFSFSCRRFPYQLVLNKRITKMGKKHKKHKSKKHLEVEDTVEEGMETNNIYSLHCDT